MADLSAALPGVLERLEARQLVRALSEAEPAFTFKHNLVQQAAYESLLAADRRHLHRVVGETLEGLFGERKGEAAEMLAGHFQQAGDSTKALAYATLAAEQALRRFATAEAAGLFAQAIELARATGFAEERLLHLYPLRARSLELGGEYTTALSVYAELESLGRQHDAPRLELAGLIGASSLQAVPTPLFDPAASLAGAERSLALAKSIGDPAGQAKAFWLQMLAQTRLNASAAVAAGEASLELARRHGLREQLAFTLNDIQSNYQTLGQPDRALQALEEARPIWSDLDNLPMLADNLASTAMLHAILADYDLGLQRSLESLAISDKIGNRWGQSYARVAIAIAHFARGDLGPAIREARRCIEDSEAAGFLYPQLALRAIMAIGYAQAGDLETADALAAQVRDIEQANPFPGQVSGKALTALLAIYRDDLTAARAHLGDNLSGSARITEAMLDSPVPVAFALGEYHLARKDFAAALRTAEELAEAFDRFEWRALNPFVMTVRARALRGLGEPAASARAFHDAYEDMVAHGFDAGLWEVEAELAAAAEADGDSAEASRWRRSAAAHARTVAEGLIELGLKDRFLARPPVQDLFGQSQDTAR